ncbi:MAG: rRNA maturation RNase YbeY [Pseudomonadota bacterium]
MNLTTPEIRIEISFGDTVEPDWADRELIQSWVINALPADLDGGEIDVRICDKPEMRDINRRFAGKDYATNVLAFPAQIDAAVPARMLGDILICAPVVDTEAREQNKTRQQHLAHMLTHAVLHLLGFDHQTVEEAERMESREVTLLQNLGFPDPYASSGQ